MRRFANHLSLLALWPSIAAAQGVAFDAPRQITSPSVASYDIFGCDVAFASPRLLAVGLRGADDAALNGGAVEVFARTSEGWVFDERLESPGIAAGDQLGEALAAGDDWIFASATRHDAAGHDAGAVWVWRLHAEATGRPHVATLLPSGVDGGPAAGSRFGSAIAYSGALLAVGGLSAEGGAVWIFELAEGVWVERARISSPSGNPLNRFGDAIAIDGDRVYVGDPLDDVDGLDAGRVFVYERAGSGWILSGSVRAVTPAPRAYFGQSIACDGAVLAVGVPGADLARGKSEVAVAAGCVELFDATGAGFEFLGSLHHPTLHPIAGANFGWDLALEAGFLAVGAPGDQRMRESIPMMRAGSVVLFRQSDADGDWLPFVSLGLDAAGMNEVFGTSVALRDGRLAVGAPGAQVGGGVAGVATAFRIDTDCNANGTPDEIEVLEGAPDCDGDGEPDECESDANGDGVPDACGCRGDFNGDGFVSAGDFSVLLTAWGTAGVGGTDLDGDGVVNAQDVALLLAAWGPCG